MDIHELNERRAQAAEVMRYLGLQSWNPDPEARIKADAHYRLMHDNWMRAEKDYADALAKLSSEELSALAKAST